MKYDYLKIYYDQPQERLQNYFFKIKNEDLIEAEKRLGRSFPPQLREFYIEVGDGFLQRPYYSINDKNYDFSDTNRILRPMIAADFYQKIIENLTNPQEGSVECDGYYVALDAIEDLQPGDLPFFEIGDSSNFLVMKLNSENPNAVWNEFGDKIEDSFERFIWRLYYENPAYFRP